MSVLVFHPVPLLACTLSLVLLPVPVPMLAFTLCTSMYQALPIITLMLQHKLSAKPQPHLRQTPARSEDKTAATTTSTTAAAYVPTSRLSYIQTHKKAMLTFLLLTSLFSSSYQIAYLNFAIVTIYLPIFQCLNTKAFHHNLSQKPI